jgi:HD-like signal output (HDOD) protein
VIGKRLAQRWGLPERLQNVIWLHHTGVPFLRSLASRLPEVARVCASRLFSHIVNRRGCSVNSKVSTW